MTVVPAILPHSLEELEEKLNKLSGFSQVQIDLCDGIVGKEKTWLPNENELLPAGFLYQFDLMVHDWRRVINYLLEANISSSIVVHVDDYTDEELQELISLAVSKNIQLGISVSNNKPIETHIDTLKKVQDVYHSVFAQVMGIRSIGQQGQPFDKETVSRVQTIRQIFPDMTIQVDGGMNPDTAREVLCVGANNVVVGSYLFKEGNIKDAVGRIEAVAADTLC